MPAAHGPEVRPGGPAFGRRLRAILIPAALLAVVAVQPAGAQGPETVAIGPDIDVYLAEREAAVPGIRPGAQKRILWADTERRPTPLALVYLHGFSASSAEISPVVERVAAAVGANVLLTRLAGHGRDGAAMAEPEVGDWLADYDEALAIGRRIGERVVVVGTSTGGSLAVVGASRPGGAEGLAGMVLVSPNFGVRARGAWLLRLPLARWYLPLIFGRERGFEPANDAHAAGWTYRYPTEALVPMARLAHAAWRADAGALGLPALFVFSPGDRIVDAERTRAVTESWGGPVTVREIAPGPGDDPAAHLIAGDVLSPGQTDRVVGYIVEWLRGLEHQPN